MQRDAMLLRAFRACLVLGGAFALFVVLDVVLALAGIYPWSDPGPSLLRLLLSAAIAALAFIVAALTWRGREERDLGGVEFADAVIVVGYMLVGGFLLLAAIR
jgi:hypothetical protein